MTAIDTVGTDDLQELAHRHLLMHFTRNGAFGPDGNRLLVLERGEGAYVFDTEGRRYLDGLSSLFCCQIGYSHGEEMAAAADATDRHAAARARRKRSARSARWSPSAPWKRWATCSHSAAS